MALKTIVLKGQEIRKEYTANAGITPGMLVEVMSTGNVRVHATDAGNAAKLFAMENDIVGKDIDGAYVANEKVQCASCHSGMEVYAWLSAGENVAINDLLDSAGDGRLDKHVAPTEATGTVMVPATINLDSVVCRSLETLDLSASGVATARIKVEIV